MSLNWEPVLQVLNIPTKINKGTVEITSNVALIKAGEKVGASEATLLAKLGIKPFSYGLIVKFVSTLTQICKYPHSTAVEYWRIVPQAGTLPGPSRCSNDASHSTNYPRFLLLTGPLYHFSVLGCLGSFKAVLSYADAAKSAIAALPHVMFETLAYSVLLYVGRHKDTTCNKAK